MIDASSAGCLECKGLMPRAQVANQAGGRPDRCCSLTTVSSRREAHSRTSSATGN